MRSLAMLVLGFMLVCSATLATELQLQLNQLRPTQAVISHEQVALKVAKYQRQPQRFARDLAERPLKTVVLGPQQQYYLTDGHHTFSAMLEFSPMGAAQQVTVEVTADQSHLSEAAFWQWLQEHHLTWLYDGNGQRISPAQLPARLGREALADDPLRGVMYLLRGNVWRKPKPAMPFIEFYWANYLRRQAPHLTQAPEPGVLAQTLWLEQLAEVLRHTPPTTRIGPNGETAAAMGLQPVHPYQQPLLPSLASSLAEDEWLAVVEIPAGERQKWQVSKQDQDLLEWEFSNGQPRQVAYLGYPVNYGALPNTLAAKARGGDGDPLDVLILGEPLPKGIQLPVRIIGRMRMHDNGEQDDKYLAVLSADSVFGHLQSLQQLQQEFPGVTTSLEVWFSNYKGPDGKVTEISFDEQRPEAMN